MFILVANNLRLFFKDRKAVILTFLLPIGLTSLFMFIFGGAGNSNRGMSELDLGVCDLVQNKRTQQTVADLDNNKTFRVEMAEDSAALRDQVHKGKVDAGMIIREKNGKPSYLLLLDGSKEVQNAMLKPVLNFQLMKNGGGGMKEAIAQKIRKEFKGISDSDMVVFNNKFNEFVTINPDEVMSGTVETQVLKPDTGIHPGAIQAISGTALMTLLFAVAGMGAGIIEEKEKGTLRRILIAPIRPMDFMFSKLMASLAIAFLQLLFTLLFCWLVFGLPVFQRPIELVLLIVFTAAACASFGILLAGLCDSRKQIESLSTIVVLLMSLLGGSMIPAFVMPPLMQKFSMLTINYWSGEGFFDIFYRNVDFTYFVIKIGVLALYSFVLIGISIWLFRKKLSHMA